MTVRRRVLLVVLAAVGVTTNAVACSSSDDVRESFVAFEPDSSAVSSPPASVPEAAAPSDASEAAIEAGVDARPPFDPTDEPVACLDTSAPCAVQLAAGEGHFCARMNDGTVRCWGDNTKGSLGLGASDAGADAGDAGFFVGTVTGLSGVTQISAGGTTTCATVDDGGVRCWGGNDRAQLGISAKTDLLAHATPSAVALPSPASRVDVGQRSACAFLGTGDLWCWGDNSQRELARPAPTTVDAPAKVALGTLAFVQTTAGTNTGFGVTSDGQLYVWGAVYGAEGSVAGRLASLSPDPSPAPVALGPVTSFSVSSTTAFYPPTGGSKIGVGHACAIVSGAVQCWGASLMGAMGNGLPDPVRTPGVADVQSDVAWPQQVAAAGDLTCVRLTDGTVQCAGDNSHGALGRDTTDAYGPFFEPAELFTGHAVRVSLAKGTACALLQHGSVLCWGSNEHGELGQGTTDKLAHPTPSVVRF